MFEERLPKEDADSVFNVRHSLGLGLPAALPQPRRIDIIANGPSARESTFWDHETTLALNGAKGLFDGMGLAPTMWAACDAQPLVADFLATPNLGTLYFPATKCHPSVFRALRGYRVKTWNVDDGSLPDGISGIPTASSITLMAIQLAPRLGYSDVHVWGWDCCVLDGQDHASGGSLNGEVRELQFRPDRYGPILASFLTTNGLAYEAQQAGLLIQALRWYGITVTVHGPGLVAHYLNFLESPPHVS